MTNKHKRKKWSRAKARQREDQTLMLIKMLGDKCALCKRQFPPGVYDFHHKDPEEKRFNISRKLGSISDARLVKEAKKCILLCANCHRIAHIVQDRLFKKKEG